MDPHRVRWNLKNPFGLSPSKPRAALRQAQRERFQITRKCESNWLFPLDGYALIAIKSEAIRR
jgi:hypothetical protein